MPPHTQREEDIKGLATEFVDNLNCDVNDGNRRSMIEDTEELFSSYNKQLLDGIERDIREMPTKTIHETLDYVNKEATLLAVNKYRV